MPAGKRVWSSTPVAEAYTIPTVLVYYYSAEGELIQDILQTPVRQDMQPLWNLRFTFPPRTLRHLRLLQTATSPADIWSIGEARFFRGQNEVMPSHADARPFPWDIGLAFDQNPVTRWRSWESIHPGMHVDIDFGAPVELDRVELHCVPRSVQDQRACSKVSTRSWKSSTTLQPNTCAASQPRPSRRAASIIC